MNGKAPSRWRIDWVAFPGALIGLTAVVLPWLTLRPNRLAAGESIGILEALGPVAAVFAVLWLLCLTLARGSSREWRLGLLGLLGSLLLPATLTAAGLAASRLLTVAPSTARASLGPGVWLGLLASYVVVHATRTRLRHRRALRAIVTWSGPLLVLLAGLLGAFGDLSLAREFAGNEARFLNEAARHVALAATSVCIGALVAIPLGVLAYRNRRIERPVFAITSAFETIPSLALFGLLMAPLSALSHAYPALRELGIRGVGAAPALIALVIYSLLPIVHNTYAGLRQVNPAAIEAARGMGMSRRQVAWRVEFPLAAPLIGQGVRTASVQAVGNTTGAALIGAGGLGHFIFQGLGQAAPDLILLGAVPVIGLAVAVDLGLGGLVRLLTAKGLRGEEGP